VSYMDTIRIITVDDNDDARAFLRRFLCFESNIDIVAEAQNGLEAVELVRELQPHAVVSDLNMPIMDGITACGIIKKEFPAIQVIIMSVQDDAGPMRAAIENGAAAFLIKPVPPDDLLDLIHRAYRVYLSIAAKPAA
jgi:DNA-binding NarL/FixJ family response regulator